MRRIGWLLCLAACSVGDGPSGMFDGSGALDVPKADAIETDTGASSDGDADTDERPAEDTDEDAPEPNNDEARQYLEDARANFPRYLDLHEKVIQRTCTPFDNVCHNNREYPDLRTPQGMLDRMGQPCNIVELHEDPLSVFNACEPPGDRIRFLDGGQTGWSSEIAYVDFIEDPEGNITSAQIVLADPVGGAGEQNLSVVIERPNLDQMLPIGTLSGVISYTSGAPRVEVNWAALSAADQALLDGDVLGGDPNRDGVFGASDPDSMRQLIAGDPDRSYLLKRLQGEVPGSPMPLANQPLDASEIIALACWIEGAADPALAGVDATIDYDNCSYALDFVEPPSGGGATLSAHVQPIFDTYCAAGGCHGSNSPAAGLDLSPGNARASLLEDSSQNPGVPRVTPLNPTNSYLVVKLVSDGQSGVQMPIGGTLPEGELEVIRTWILQGAPDN